MISHVNQKLKTFMIFWLNHLRLQFRKKEAMKRINQAIEEKNPDLINDWIEE